MSIEKKYKFKNSLIKNSKKIEKIMAILSGVLVSSLFIALIVTKNDRIELKEQKKEIINEMIEFENSVNNKEIINKKIEIKNSKMIEEEYNEKLDEVNKEVYFFTYSLLISLFLWFITYQFRSSIREFDIDEYKSLFLENNNYEELLLENLKKYQTISLLNSLDFLKEIHKHLENKEWLLQKISEEKNLKEILYLDSFCEYLKLFDEEIIKNNLKDEIDKINQKNKLIEKLGINQKENSIIKL